MLQGVLIEQMPITVHPDRRSAETHPYLHVLDATAIETPSLTSSTFQIRLLGEFQVRMQEYPVSSLDVPRLQSLLAYLVLHRGVPQSRSRLAYLLWPDSTEGQAHTNLRNLLYKLRTSLPIVDRFLQVERQTLCWRSDGRWSLDVMDFEQALARAEQASCDQDDAAEQQALEEAVRLYQGDLLPACYDEWMQSERERLQQAYVGALERLIELLEYQGNHPAAIRAAQRLLRHDPLQETTYRHLMRLYAARGERAAISRTYQTCAAVLRRELALEPCAMTRQTYERLMRAGA